MTATSDTIDDSGKQRLRTVAPITGLASRGNLQRQVTPRRAMGLGWFTIGKGLVQLVAPRSVAHTFGIRDTRVTRAAIRLLGAQELLEGVGLLSGRRNSLWMRSRVVGDVLDMGLLGLSFVSPGAAGRSRVPVGLMTIAGVTAMDIFRARAVARPGDGGTAAAEAAVATVSAAITIDRSPGEVYAFWRDFQNLSRFMFNVESVRTLDDVRSRWVVTATGKSIHWEATVTEDRAGELIAWRTVQGADIAHNGEVRFRPAPGGRGTDVSVKLRTQAPRIPLGPQMTRLASTIPRNEIKSDLRRLKQVMELRALVRSDASIHVGAHPARPASKSTAVKSS